MTSIYICNSIEDIATFIKMFPEACWSNGTLLNVDNDFNLRKSPPVALYKIPNVNAVTWSSVRYAKDYLQFNPSLYTLGALQPLLDLAAVFVTFLKHSNAYDKYIDSFDLNYGNDINLQASKLISQAFFWHVSYESGCYWKALNTEWEKLLKHFSIDPTTVLTDVLTTVKEYK